MIFSSDPSTQSQEVMSPGNIRIQFMIQHKNSIHDSIYLNYNSLHEILLQKGLGMHIVTKLILQENLNNILSIVDKTIWLLHKIQAVLLRPSLVTIY